MNEQWKELKETIVELRDSNGTGTQQEVCKFLVNYMGILEKQMQEPCEDAISREDALMCLTGEIKETDTIETIIARFVRRIRKLPPVNTQPRTGHWVEHPEIETSTPEYLMFYECSECGDKQCFCKSDIHKKRFCGNCGIRMFEPQESEEI